MPQSGDSEHFHGRHHLVLILLVVGVCALVLMRLGWGWRAMGQGEPARAIELQLDPNTASAQELAAIPGVGPSLAERIVAYRERQLAAGQNPVFTDLSDLDRVEGVGVATLESIGPYLHLPSAKP